MIGAYRTKKNYIGQDINEQHIKESVQISNHINYRNVVLKVQDIFKDVQTEYESLFTCPPYENKEIWNNDNDKNMTCDEWMDLCLDLYKCKKYLFVVDKTEKYKRYVVDEITNKSHFNQNKEYIIFINNYDK